MLLADIYESEPREWLHDRMMLFSGGWAAGYPYEELEKEWPRLSYHRRRKFAVAIIGELSEQVSKIDQDQSWGLRDIRLLDLLTLLVRLDSRVLWNRRELTEIADQLRRNLSKWLRDPDDFDFGPRLIVELNFQVRREEALNNCHRWVKNPRLVTLVVHCLVDFYSLEDIEWALVEAIELEFVKADPVPEIRIAVLITRLYEKYGRGNVKQKLKGIMDLSLTEDHARRLAVATGRADKMYAKHSGSK